MTGHHEPPRKVSLLPYNPAWPKAFVEAAAAIRQACAPWVTEVHHIGSTAVPGLPAKPIIDIMPGLARYEDGFQCIEPMERLGYTYHGEFGIPRRHYFNRRGGSFDHNVHMYAVGEGQWHWQLAFRDHLRANPADRERYYQLKMELAARYPWDVEAYADAKSNFVRSILRQHLDLDERYRAR